MSVALATEVGEVLHSDRGADRHGALPTEGVVGDEVLDGTVLISSRTNRSFTTIVIPTFTAIGFYRQAGLIFSVE